MELVSEFLRHAAECLEMARKANNEPIRAQLEELARQWTNVAVEREKILRLRDDLKNTG